MFKLHKHRHDKSRDKFDFKFSSFQAIQVPKGWDKLFISLVPVETGKTSSKLAKTSVRNGTCRWTETLSESVHIPRKNMDSKELESCHFKFVVAMGSSRSSILGEVTINLADYANSKTITPVVSQLKRCSYTTSLQFKIQCLTPKTIPSDAQNKETDVPVEYGGSDHDDMENNSDASDGAFSRSVGSTSSNHLESASISHNINSRDPSLSASDSRRSFDSVEVSSGKDIFSPQSNPSRDAHAIGRLDSVDSISSGPTYSQHASNEDNHSNHSSVQRDPNSSAFLSSPYSNAGSSKDLLDAAELTIEELRAEARMWERNAKKSMEDVNAMKEELAEQSKTQGTLNMELSASQQECNALKLEIEQLKNLLEELSKKHDTKEHLKLQAKDMNNMQHVMEEEIGLLKESNADLTEQLQKTQESNIELLSILQELEGIVETQKLEIDNLSSYKLKFEESEKHSPKEEDSNTQKFFSCASDLEGKKTTQAAVDVDADFPEDISNINVKLQQVQEAKEELENTIYLLEKTIEVKDNEIELGQERRMQSLLDLESEWGRKVAIKDEEIMQLETKLSEAINELENKSFDVEIGVEADLVKENELLRGKVEDLEKDCDELTQENLELLLKFKESGNDSVQPDTLNSSSCVSHDNYGSACGSDASELRTQLTELNQELRNKEAQMTNAATAAQSQVLELENKCANLEHQLQSFKQKNFHLEDELQMFHARVEEQQMEVHALQQQLKQGREMEIEAVDPHFLVPDVNSASQCPNKLSDIAAGMRKLLHYSLMLSKNHNHSLNFCADPDSFEDIELKCAEPLTWEEQISVTLDFLSKISNFLELEYNRQGGLFQNTEEDDREKLLNKYESVNSNGYASYTDAEELEKSDTVIVSDSSKALQGKALEIEAEKSEHLSREDEIKVLTEQLSTLENQISSLRDENCLLEESVENMKREKTTSSDCLEELKQEITTLQSSVESHVSTNKTLERLSSELGKGKEDLEQQLSDLEKENMQLSGRISALEAQLRYLTNDKETCYLELRHSESQVVNLREEVRRLETEVEGHKLDMKQKLQDVKNQWLEAQEECEYLKKANPKLQTTAENLIEECTSLQTFNGELKRHNVVLHTRCSELECQLRDSNATLAECPGKIDTLEAEFTMMLEEVSLKEKSFKSEIDSLIIEEKEHNEKLVQENILLNQMYSQKVVEFENLQGELVHLIDQISLSHDEQESMSSEAMLELSVLRADKAKLEAALRELQEKFTISEKKLITLQAESEAKVHELTRELIDSRQNQQILIAEHEMLSATLEIFKNNEEKHKSIVDKLEMTLKASNYEKLQLSDEISSHKEQLRRANLFQDEVVSLKTDLNDAKAENERIKVSLNLLYANHEELKIEKDSLVQKTSSMEKCLLELEDCQHSKIALEEKILRLEGDLAAKEALCAQDAEVKFELSKLKRTNGELQRKIKHLGQDKEHLTTAQSHEEQLKQKHEIVGSGGSLSDLDDESIATASSCRDVNKRLGDPGMDNLDIVSKIRSLETELSEALEANEMYKEQLRRFLSEEQNNCTDDPKISASVEMELRDLRERYFQMSLKYAEVEAQREDLVMKLKSTTNKKSWFY